MHSAPAVSYPVGRSSLRTAFFLVPWLLGGAVCGAWAWQSDHWYAIHGLALLLCLLVSWLVFQGLRHPVTGMLRWDGQHWNWETGGCDAVGLVSPRLDWQQGLLLEFRSFEGKVFWLWPDRQADSLRWDALRRALYAPVAVPAGPGGQPAGDGVGP